MSSPFERIMAIGDAVIDSVMGDEEGFAYQPMKAAVDAAPVADASRAAIANLIAVFEDGVRTDDAQFVGRTTTQPQVRVVKTKLPQGARKKDLFTRLATGIIYQVADIRADDADLRWTIWLVKVGRA